MTPVASRVVRGALLAVLLAVIVSVALTVKKGPKPPVPSPTPSSAAAPSPTPPPKVPETEKIVYRQVFGNREALVLHADRMIGDEQEEVQLSGVQMEFAYVRQGQLGHGTISADACSYTKAIGKAVFIGNVVVRSQDGAELRTGKLVYNGQKQTARTDEPVAFVRKAFSGTGVGMDYAAAEERVEFHSDVSIRIDDPDDPLTLITAGKALIDRSAGSMKLAQDVVVRRPGEEIHSDRLVADMTPEQTISRAEAEGNVTLQTTANAASSGGPGIGAGRTINAKRLEIFFENGQMKQAMAGPDAELILAPGEKDPDRRRLQGRFISFAFDAAGHLTELQANKDVVFRMEPARGGKAEARELRCQQLVAAMDPATGQVQDMSFSKDVTFVQGTRRGEAEGGNWIAKDQILSLRRKASLREGDTSLLEAQSIDLGTATGSITAEGRLRHFFKGGAGGGVQGGLMRGEEGATITSRDLAYDGKAKVARYTGGATLVSGSDTITGDVIQIAEDAAGARTLRAEKDVTARLSPKPKAGATEAAGAQPIRSKSGTLVYDEKKREIQFDGNVRLEQGELVTTSPKATVTLEADGGAVKTLVAGEPVSVVQGKRKAAGKQATYTPAQDQMVIVGDKVTLEDPGQQKVEGRSITFKLKDDRIVVDGQERTRTEMRMQRALPSPSPKAPAPAPKPSASPAVKKP